MRGGRSAPSLRRTRFVLSTIAAGVTFAPAGAAKPTLTFEWTPVVNNGDVMPGSTKTFNSYNQPSVNAAGLVVFRARGKGPGEPPHGIYVRDMRRDGGITKIFDRTSVVPDPNPLGRTFIEFPSFPRIDRDSAVLATRGNHQPVATSSDGEAVGTTGIYANPRTTPVTGAAQLAAVPGLSFFAVPGAAPGTRFDVFPGAPAVSDGNVIVFKGNYTEDAIGKTGVYFRELRVGGPGNTLPIQLLANTATPIPGAPGLTFGSTAPPSAAEGQAVFTGLDNEAAPTAGGIYLVPLEPSPELTTLVRIGSRVPDRTGRATASSFNRLGEGLSFDGRFVGFWGAWGSAVRTVTLHCPTEGNAQRRAYCLVECPEPAGCTRDVPTGQGMFVHDTWTGITRMAAETGDRYRDFLFWNFSGKVPGTADEDDGEPARWRFAAFAAVDSSTSGTFQLAFKAATTQGSAIDLAAGPGKSLQQPQPIVDTTLDGGELDVAAAGLPITEVGLERDGFRNGWLVVNARMGTEEAGWAGIYVAHIAANAPR